MSLSSSAKETRCRADSVELPDFPPPALSPASPRRLQKATAAVCHLSEGSRRVPARAGGRDPAGSRDPPPALVSGAMPFLLPLLQGWRLIRFTRDTWRRGLLGKEEFHGVMLGL